MPTAENGTVSDQICSSPGAAPDNQVLDFPRQSNALRKNILNFPDTEELSSDNDDSDIETNESWKCTQWGDKITASPKTRALRMTAQTATIQLHHAASSEQKVSDRCEADNPKSKSRLM